MFEDVRWPIRATPSVYIECDAVSWKDAHVPWNRDAAAFKYLPSLSIAQVLRLKTKPFYMKL